MQRWDAAWFQWIAAEGYSPDDAAARSSRIPAADPVHRLVSPLDGADAATLGLQPRVRALARRAVRADTVRVPRPGVGEAGGGAVRLPADLLLLPRSAVGGAVPAGRAARVLLGQDRSVGVARGRRGFAACLIRSLGVALVRGARRRGGAPSTARTGPGVRSEARRRRRRAPRSRAYAAVVVGAGRGSSQPLRAQAPWQRQLTFPSSPWWTAAARMEGRDVRTRSVARGRRLDRTIGVAAAVYVGDGSRRATRRRSCGRRC